MANGCSGLNGQTEFLSTLTPAKSAEAWHSLASDACFERLGGCPDGLPTLEAERRRADVGPNRLELAAGRSIWQILWDQFSNVMLIMLLAVAAVSAGVAYVDQKFPKDAIAIVLIVGLNGLLGYLQESRAQQALLALRTMAQPMVQVRRDGQWQRLSSEELVPGDLIRLEAGDKVPADARLLEAVDLGAREAALTGEAEAVFKKADLVLEPATPVLERLNCLFQGTEVVRGRGVAVVTSTGMATELGQIAELINTAGGESTPLQERLDGLAKVLVGSSLALVALVVGLGLLLGQDPLNLLEVSLSMAVAIVPEGLPAVITVTLAIGTQRMVRRAALIRRLPAVEALGSVTVICSDKTGTLTQNRQVVQELRLGTQAVAVSGLGYDPVGSFTATALAGPAGASAGAADGLQTLLVQASVLCSDAELRQDGSGVWEVLGDPTEGALAVVAGKAGYDDFALRQQYPRRAEIPFSSERQLMAVWVADPDGSLQAPLGAAAEGSQQLLINKGAPEVILSACSRWVDGSGVVPLSDEQRQWWLQQARDLAASGLRVLAFACGPHHPSPEQPLDNQALLGLMAQLDPARPEVAQAVATCKSAGIRPVMITGDHPLTARAIGIEIGLTSPDGEVTLGRQLEACSDEELRQVVARCSVYARVPPEQKLRIVKALQANGQVVAMTGDGVNDAPALKQSHIGVAMGITGTEVSKEAADMVLLDDNFATIVSAVEEGRLVYANIRRFVKYILGSNVGELITIAAAPLVGVFGVPLTPLQILWMNLVTDGVPALALALEPAEDGLMDRDPARPGESIFARGIGRYILRVGVVFALIVIGLMLWSYRYEGAEGPWKTMVFTTLCLAQMGHALSARSDKPLIQVNPFSNPWLLWAVVLTSGLQLLLLYVPWLSRFFGTVPLQGADLLICVGVSLVFFVYLEAEKLLRQWRRRATANVPTSLG
ncbi:MAG: cation-transporting P-type ATPase [Cyanobacteria bacterium K_DeepCast_150m_m2_101]|nr:cation-transporting P-type ATPase [Cyanobacteria bacterium K_Offshore_0m_m2_072]MBM5819520.1 cation-transporting P-type ATPase [Cyanobacteria bacterium K_DeepCast_150m_m2_101]MBM5826339.1 cation-transporting P-type ATPase [Cyanobacteria bacterium M_surface_10_m2_119]